MTKVIKGRVVGLVQLKKLRKNIESREKNFNIHNKFFKKYEEFFILPKKLLATQDKINSSDKLKIRPKSPDKP